MGSDRPPPASKKSSIDCFALSTASTALFLAVPAVKKIPDIAASNFCIIGLSLIMPTVGLNPLRFAASIIGLSAKAVPSLDITGFAASTALSMGKAFNAVFIPMFSNWSPAERVSSAPVKALTVLS